jgi:hypothetical protein
MTASIHVDRVLKGSVDSQVVAIEYQGYPHTEKSNTVFPSRYNLLDNQYGLIFLTRKKDGIYTFADPYQGLVPITSRTVRLIETAHTAKEKVQAELFASLSDANPNIAKAALAQVQLLGVEQFITPLHGLASATEPESQGLAFAALIKLGDYSLLGPTINFVEKPTDDPSIQYWKGRITDAIRDIGYDQIRKALQAGADKQSAYCPSRTTIPFDRSVPPLLDSLLSSQNLDLRRAAAHALRGICDPSSARFLASALDNSDRHVQYDAMMGLAALEQFPVDRPAPAWDIFDESPAKYLDAWKIWWTATGKQKYSKRHLT